MQVNRDGVNRLAPYLQVREQVQLNKLLNNMGDIIEE